MGIFFKGSRIRLFAALLFPENATQLLECFTLIKKHIYLNKENLSIGAKKLKNWEKTNIKLDNQKKKKVRKQINIKNDGKTQK